MDMHDKNPSYCFIEPTDKIGMVGNLPFYTNFGEIHE